MSSKEHVGTIIVGAGPSGLAAGAALRGLGKKFVIIERGRDLHERNHARASDLGEGVGGAGLFSDGKFSFYPSGTNLYELAHESHLRVAYDWCRYQLHAAGIDTIPFPELGGGRFSYGERAVKEYPSFYGSLSARTALISALRSAVDSNLVVGTTVRSAERARAGGFDVVLGTGAAERRVVADSMIFATGRLGPLQEELVGSGLLQLRPLRYEFGVRIEAPHERTFLASVKAADVKRLARVAGFEFRTFCTCRKGEIWNIPYDGCSAISGRSDGAPTEYSNFGFLVRFEGPTLDIGRQVWDQVQATLRSRRSAIYEPLLQFLGEGDARGVETSDRPWFPKNAFEPGDVRAALGPILGPVLQEGLRDLLAWCPGLRDPETVCLFPAVEGVGEFPSCDGSLRVSPGIWCAGDLVGRLRGIVPAFVSGFYAGLEAAAEN